MLDFITIGGATRDIFFKIDGTKKKKTPKVLEADYLMLPYGEKLVSEETFYTYGGGAANTAICLARLGLKTAPVCNVGTEGTGSLLVNVLKKQKVNTSLVKRDKYHHTGLSLFILGDDNEHTGILERGANDYLKLSNADFKPAHWFYVSSLTGEAASYLPLIFDYAKRHNIKIAFNPGSEQLKQGYKKLARYIEQTEVLVLNLEEAEKLLAEKGRGIKNKRNLLKAVCALGAKITLVTDAENGSHAVLDNKVYSQAAVPKDVIDTTGAGDSFGATFAFGVFKGHDLGYCLKIAAINSASVVSNMGAQKGLLKYNEIKSSRWL